MFRARRVWGGGGGLNMGSLNLLRRPAPAAVGTKAGESPQRLNLPTIAAATMRYSKVLELM